MDMEVGNDAHDSGFGTIAPPRSPPYNAFNPEERVESEELKPDEDEPGEGNKRGDERKDPECDEEYPDGAAERAVAGQEIPRDRADRAPASRIAEDMDKRRRRGENDDKRYHGDEVAVGVRDDIPECESREWHTRRPEEGADNIVGEK